jgi:hypothetical protein
MSIPLTWTSARKISLRERQTDLETGDLVTSGEERGVLRRSLGGGTHTVLVVLTNENTREVP